MGDRVRVTYERGGDSEGYAALLQDMLRGANVRPVELVGAIARSVRPEDLVAAVRANDVRPIVSVDESKTGKNERAQRVLDLLRERGRLHELEVLGLPDQPVIALHTGPDPDDFTPMNALSDGQQCIAILTLALLESPAPLIIDQPEDNLDNAYIYEVLVPSLLHVKKHRQIIVVTHNPNIPVLADAERVFAMGSRDRRGYVVAYGTVDAMRDAIERQLEGGREAFLRRAERYGHL